MRKVLPFVMVIGFWALFHIGKTYPGAGDTIAFVAVITFVLLILCHVKKYILDIVIKNK